MAEFNSCFLSFKLNFNETAAARAPPAVRMEIATRGMRAVVWDAQTVLLKTDNEIQNTNATFTAFFLPFHLPVYHITFLLTAPLYMGLNIRCRFLEQNRM